MDVIYDTANEYKAIQEALNAQLPCNIRVSIVRPVVDRFKVFDDGTIQGAGLRVTVTKKACNNFSINVSWSHPTSRENGDILTPDQIAGYELDINGTIYAIAPELTEHRLNGLTGGLKVLRIRTIDKDGLESEWSDELTITLE